MSSPAPDNRQVAGVFAAIADLMEILGDDTRRGAAYRRASQSIGSHPTPVAVLAAEGRLKEIPGVGDAIAAKIREIVETGTCELLERLRSQVPDGVLELLRVPGVGPRTVHRLHVSLGITSLADLEAAARDGRLRELPGMGERKEQRILAEIAGLRRRAERTPLAVAEQVGLGLIETLAGLDACEQVALAGSLRRGRDTVRDIDILCASSRPAEVLDAFCGLPDVAEVIGRGGTKASARLVHGMNCDLRVVGRESWAAALQYFTGSSQHNVRLRARARERGLKLNEYGLFKVDQDGREERLDVADEDRLYALLGLPPIPPELREDTGEVEAALAGRLPALIRTGDIRGELHCHSNWSDGRATIEEMHAAAAEAGYEYLAVTDHSPLVVVANGLDADRLLRQVERVRALRERLGPPYLLTGIEVDIRGDGRLDLPDEVLAGLDVVVASVHSQFNLDREQMTRRILSALEHPRVDILAHPTGRRLGRRDPYEVDIEAVLEAAVRTGTVVEINASPERLDLPDTQVRRAVELGAWLVINTDAHAPGHFGHLRYGITVARRGWVEPERVINTWPLDRLRRFLAMPKERRAATAIPGRRGNGEREGST
ncbi:MAG TPA: DNA polymerase/3'-5' exonuclease PolX [Bacillota bacterium]